MLIIEGIESTDWGFERLTLQFASSSRVLLSADGFALPNPAPPPGLDAWRKRNLVDIGHVQLHFDGVLGLLSQFLPCWQTETGMYVLGCLVAHVVALRISDVSVNIEEVSAPRGAWEGLSFAHSGEFGWRRTSNICMLTGAECIESWADGHGDGVREEAAAKQEQTAAAQRTSGGMRAATVAACSKLSQLRKKAAAVAKDVKTEVGHTAAKVGHTARDTAVKARDTAVKGAQDVLQLRQAVRDARHRPPQRSSVRTEILISELELHKVHVVVLRSAVPTASHAEAPSAATAVLSYVSNYHFGDLAKSSLGHLRAGIINTVSHLERLHVMDVHGADWTEVTRKVARRLVQQILFNVRHNVTHRLADAPQAIRQQAAAVALQAAMRRRQATNAVSGARVSKITTAGAALNQQAAAVMLQAAVRRRKLLAKVAEPTPTSSTPLKEARAPTTPRRRLTTKATNSARTLVRRLSGRGP